MGSDVFSKLIFRWFSYQMKIETDRQRQRDTEREEKERLSKPEGRQSDLPLGRRHVNK